MRHGRTVRLLVTALTLAGLLSLAGCLLSPRGAEAPGSGNAIQYLTQSTVENVWNNMEKALNGTDVAGWQDQLSPDFVCIDETQGDESWWETNWSYEQEVAFATSFFTSVGGIDADLFYSEIQVDEPTGEGDWVIIYSITVTEPGGGTIIYGAQARIRFKIEGNFWYIIRWTDEQAEEVEDENGQNILGQTLGVRRASFASKF